MNCFELGMEKAGTCQRRDVGVGVNAGEFTDVGLYAVTRNEADKAKFKTPSLRNIALTAPYMHDGGIGTLEEVLDHYAAGGGAYGAYVLDAMHRSPEAIEFFSQWGILNWFGPIPALRR